MAVHISDDDLTQSHHDRSNEQEQGLLKSWEHEDSAHGEQNSEYELEEKPVHGRPLQSTIFGLPRRTAGIAAIIVVLCFTALFLALLGSAARETVEDVFAVKTEDYILDPNWDHQAPPQRREYTWTIRDQVHNPDGIYRPMIIVNNQFPGPLIEVNEGDTIVVHVHNRAVNATSIHWHGIYQLQTPFMDGTPGITGCPISPGGSFTYEFTVTSQSGTYWWHAHQGVQSSDGVHGPLVIHGKDEYTMQKIPYTTDRVIMVSDHYHDLSSALLWQYLKPDMENTEPAPVGGLINGRGIRNCDDFPHRICDNTTVNVGLPQIYLAPNQNHRLRLINVAAFAEFQIQVDEHQLSVTEVDGTDVLPVPYHRISINPAQRYSVILNTNATSAESFWLRARMISGCFTDAPKNLEPDVLAVVNYGGNAATAAIPESKDWDEQLWLECRDMNVSALRPVQAVQAPPADALFYLRSNFEQGAYRLNRGFFNTSTWKPDLQHPTLLRAMDGLKTENISFMARDPSNDVFINDAAFDRPHELVVQSNGVRTIDLFIDNFDDGQHPLHLHGYKYFVLAQGHGAPPMTSVQDGFSRENLEPLYDSLDLSNPLRRDTASVEAYGWILLRVVADNPGAWAFHCHVSWHSEAGLLMQLITGTDALKVMQVPQSSLDLCTAPGIEKGSGPDDVAYEDLAK